MKKKFLLCKLNFTAPLHIGTVRDDYDRSEGMIHSDTLYAALFETWSLLGKSDWIIPEPRFALSSLMPYTTAKSGREVYFFKKLLLPPVSDQNLSLSTVDRKKLKKIEYVDAAFFQQMIQNNSMPEVEHVKGCYATVEDIDSNFMRSSSRPRIKKSILEGDPEIFYMDLLFFNSDSGLYFLYEGEESDWERVAIALNHLSESGLGTDRNVGLGSFRYSVVPFELEVPDSSDYCTNLSLFLPNTAEQIEWITPDNCSFELMRRGGWIGEPYNHYRKRTVCMLREGAIMANTCQTPPEPAGQTVDLRPLNTPTAVTHPIYRVGRSIFIPIHLNQKSV